MTDAREIIARQIEPQAWAALGIGDTLAYRNRRTSSDRKAIRIMQELAAAGIRLAGPGDRILGPDEVDPVTVVRPLDEWHEDFGDAVWWTWEGDRWLGEPSYIGGPNDSDWPGYHTHWSPHPPFPCALGRKA